VRALLLPVKKIENAKQRLAGFLTPDERQALMAAMTADLFAAAHAAQAPDHVFVVTADLAAATSAAGYGWTVLNEETQISESHSVDDAAGRCAGLGVTALLRLPLDLPLVTGADIDGLFAAAPSSPGVLMVPSRDGTGTNAILRTPPTLFPSHFGPNSYSKHLREAAAVNAALVECRNPNIEMDVDDPADLRALLALGAVSGATGAWILKTRIMERLASG